MSVWWQPQDWNMSPKFTYQRTVYIETEWHASEHYNETLVTPESHDYITQKDGATSAGRTDGRISWRSSPISRAFICTGWLIFMSCTVTVSHFWNEMWRECCDGVILHHSDVMQWQVHVAGLPTCRRKLVSSATQANCLGFHSCGSQRLIANTSSLATKRHTAGTKTSKWNTFI